MDLPLVLDALREQCGRPTDRRLAERAIGAGLLRWAEWCDAVQRGEGAAGTSRGDTALPHARRRSLYANLGIEGHGQLWSVVEMVVVSRLSQANAHARAIGTLLYQDGLTTSVRVLLRVHAEACMRGVWVGDPNLDPRTALQRAIAQLAEEANAMSADQRRKLQEEIIRPLARAAGLPLYSAGRGRWRASGTVRPDTRALIRQTSTLGKDLAEWPTHAYGLHSAAVHSSLQGWLAAALDEDQLSLRALSLDILHAAAIHHRLEAIYEAWHDWRPRDAMAVARQISLSSLALALCTAEGTPNADTS